jgi:uncharacterized protein YbjT (DUF2867 family)
MGLNSRSILLAGATGLVGGLALRRLLEHPDFTGRIFAPTRRDPGISDPRLIAIRTDFAQAGGESVIADAISARQVDRLDVYVSCLGTTIGTAGSREAFVAVDRDLVLRLAQSAYERGARHAILVSSAGASRQSGTFYLRVKGEIEDALEGIGFERLDIVQPGLLLGERAEHRSGEALARALAPLFNRALLGKLRRYRAIDADCVARAIVRLLEFDAPGRFVHEHDSIRELAVGRK